MSDAANAPEIDSAILDLHRSILTLDAHIDVRNSFHAGEQDAGEETSGQFDLPKFERGGLDVAVIALAADPVRNDEEGQRLAREQVERKYAALTRLIEQYPDRVGIARSAAEISARKAAGKKSIVFSFLNAVSLGTRLEDIALFHERGVRLLGLGHSGNNAFVDSSRPNPAFGDTPNAHGGLSALGRQAIAELNRLGIIVDVSQFTPAALEQAAALSKTPVIASHSAVRGRIDVPRNLSNAELQTVAALGGVVHIVTFAPYIRDRDGSREAYVEEVFKPFGLEPNKDDPQRLLSPEDFARFRKGYEAFSHRRLEFASLVDYLDALDYAVRLIGVDHVGIGSDFNNGGGVRGYAHVGEAHNVTRELLRRGYSESDIEKLWGGNFLRVFQVVEDHAQA
jgi:membrane dipeptidase